MWKPRSQAKNILVPCSLGSFANYSSSCSESEILSSIGSGLYLVSKQVLILVQIHFAGSLPPHIMPVFRLAIHFGTISFGPGQPTLQSWLRAQRARQLLHFYNTAQRSYTFEYAPQPTSSPRLSDKFAPPTPLCTQSVSWPERAGHLLLNCEWEIYMLYMGDIYVY